MAGLLAQEIHQTRPFDHPGVEAVLGVIRTAEMLMRQIGTVLKDWDLSQPQYNILRILRGAGDQGLSCRAIGDRLVTLDPDVTRLLDKLEARGLVQRQRDSRDRRLVLVRLTEAGRRLVNDAHLNQAIARTQDRICQGLAPADLTQLIDLLEDLRRNCSATPTPIPS